MKDQGFTLLVATVLWTTCQAENPVVQTKFTADPAPLARGNRAISTPAMTRTTPPVLSFDFLYDDRMWQSMPVRA